MTEPNSKRPTAVPTVQVDNTQFIVTEWRFAPRAETGWHRHGHHYVVVPQTTGELTIETTQGSVQSSLIAGSAYAREIGVEHNVVNNNDFEFVFVEVESK